MGMNEGLVHFYLLLCWPSLIALVANQHKEWNIETERKVQKVSQFDEQEKQLNLVVEIFISMFFR